MPKKALNVGSLLSQVAKKDKSPKSKSKNPSVDLPKMESSIKAWLKAAQDEKDAKARKGSAEEEFLASAEEARIAASRKDGKFYSSVKLNGKVTVSVQSKYSPIDPEDHEDLERAFGDKTEQYFMTKTEIKLTEGALNDENILKKLIAVVGEDAFGDYFEVKQTIIPTALLHEGRATDAEIGEKANTLIESGILRPYKASVKVGA